MLKNIFTMKNLIAAILAGIMLMFIMITTPKGKEPLSAEGSYTYPDYCIGHESEFVVDISSNSYQNGGFVGDAIEYVGDKGDFSYGEIELTTSVYDESSDSFYNPSIDFGFKVPQGWTAHKDTMGESLQHGRMADIAFDGKVNIPDFCALSPDKSQGLRVRYHSPSAEGIKIKNFADYWDIKTEPYWQAGYKNISYTNIFAGDKFCDIALCCDETATDKGKVFIASQILNDKYIMVIEYVAPYDNTDSSVWENFYSEAVG